MIIKMEFKKAGALDSLVKEMFGEDQRTAQIVEELHGFPGSFGKISGPLTLNASLVFSGSVSCGFPASTRGGAWIPDGFDFQSFRLETSFGLREGDGRNVAAARLGELLMRDIDKQYIALTSGRDTHVEILQSTVVLCDSRNDSDFDKLLTYLSRCGIRSKFAPELVKCDGVEWAGLERLLTMRPNSVFLVERTLVKLTSWSVTPMGRDPSETAVLGSVADEYKRTVRWARLTPSEKFIHASIVPCLIGLFLFAIGQSVFG